MRQGREAAGGRAGAGGRACRCGCVVGGSTDTCPASPAAPLSAAASLSGCPSPQRLPAASGPLVALLQEDLELAASMGSNCFRISLEWSRLEPARGQWDEGAAQHYRDILACMRRWAAAWPKQPAGQAPRRKPGVVFPEEAAEAEQGLGQRAQGVPA